MRPYFSGKKNVENEKTAWAGTRGGFTFIELLVVIAVIGIISAVAIFNHRGMQDRLEISNDAQMVVLSVREVRVMALSVRETLEGSFEDRFRRGHGLYFSTDEDDRSAFVYFIDLDDENRYTDPLPTSDCSSEECVRSIFLQGGNTIYQICKLSDTGADENCGDFASVEIFFRRPSTDATITFSPDLGSDQYRGAVIKLRSLQGRELDVVIEDTGMASVREI